LFLTLDNIAVFLIQPPVGTWSDRLRTPINRRMPFLLIGSHIGALAFGFLPLIISLFFLSGVKKGEPAPITPTEAEPKPIGIINFKLTHFTRLHIHPFLC